MVTQTDGIPAAAVSLACVRSLGLRMHRGGLPKRLCEIPNKRGPVRGRRGILLLRLMH
jgi:hypothetical protein